MMPAGNKLEAYCFRNFFRLELVANPRMPSDDNDGGRAIVPIVPSLFGSALPWKAETEVDEETAGETCASTPSVVLAGLLAWRDRDCGATRENGRCSSGGGGGVIDTILKTLNSTRRGRLEQF
jgi:hypothetical protein